MGNRGVKEGLEFATLTNEVTQARVGLTTKQYKSLEGLKKENLRDNTTNLKLVLNTLAETATTGISQKRRPINFPESKVVAQEGGTVAENTRKEVESKTGKKVITSKNTEGLKLLKEEYNCLMFL